MKKLLAAVLALTMAFSMSACAKSNEETKNETKGEEQTSPVDDGLVTVYQRVSETEYKADGTKGHTQKRYTYDDHNNLLAIETDNGPYQEVDMGDFMVKVPLAFDGTIENSSYFLYTDDGRLMVNNFYNGPVIENGKLIETVISRNGECYYTYLSDGRINTCEQYVIGLDGPLYDEPTASYKCNYNENNQLVSVIGVAPEWNAGARTAEWKYDDQGRMIEERYYWLEGTHCWRYTYNDQGLLTMAEYGYLNVDKYGNCTGTEEIFTAHNIDTYTYDDAGRLIDSNGDAITYDDQGRVVTYGNATVTYLADGSKKVQTGDRLYEYDQHGNLVRYTTAEGYVEIVYRSIRVTKEEAKRLAFFDLQRQMKGRWNYRSYTYEYICKPDYPQIPLMEFDLVINRESY